MNKSYFFSALLVLLGFSMQIFAQTDPGTANLKHQWTFDKGSAVDAVGGVTGTIVGNGSLVNNAFVATNAYMNFPAAEIGINSYPGLTVEIWCTSVAGANGGWSMLSYFGETVGGGGQNYTFLSIARNDNVSMAALGTTVWNGATGPEYDDGRLHHFAYTISETDITLFIDGIQIATSALAAGNSLANISTSLAYLGRGGWTGDPNWVGSYHKYSIYNKALNDDEILYLFQQGAEDDAVINVTASAIALDTNYPAEIFTVSGVNLTTPVTITAPQGITVMPSTFTATTDGEDVFVVWDGMNAVDGNIVLTSGAVTAEIRIKTADDSECFVLMYDDVTNLVDDPGLNSITFFTGWGSREVSNIISDPENVYCGASSIGVGNGTSAGSGSLDVPLTGKLSPNTFYRVKAMVKTVDGTFQLGVWGWASGQGDINNVINTNGEWMPLEFSFTTGATLGGTQGMFWNNWACTGTKGYIDNWEMYEAIEPVLSVSKAFEAFDPEYTSVLVTVTGLNLTEAISITTPAGVTAIPNSLTEAAGAEVILTWDGSTPVNGNVTFNSSGVQSTLALKSTSVSNTDCFVPLYSDKLNLVPDPFINDLSFFSGWGGRGIVSIAENPDSVYCGSHSGRIFGGGSLDVILSGKMDVNTNYIARAMIMTIGGAYQMGVWGMDALSNADVQDSIDTQGTWMPIVLEFATAETLPAVQGMFINNYQRSGKRAFIDNWELYAVSPSSVRLPMEGYTRIFNHGNTIVAEYDLNNVAQVEIAVYSLQGALVAHTTATGISGRNRSTIETELPMGMYLVRISAEGKQYIQKLMK